MADLNKSDVCKILNLIQTEYPRVKEPNEENFILRMDLWFDALSQYSREEVYKAVSEAITVSEFEPRLKNISDICKRNRNPFTKSPLDLWNEIIDAFPIIGEAVKDIEMGYDRAWNPYTQDFDSESYYARGKRALQEVFDSFAPEVRRYFGNAPERLAALYNLSRTERNCEKGRFLKNVQPFIEQQEAADRNGMGDFFNRLTDNADVKKLNDKNNEGDT